MLGTERVDYLLNKVKLEINKAVAVFNQVLVQSSIWFIKT